MSPSASGRAGLRLVKVDEPCHAEQIICLLYEETLIRMENPARLVKVDKPLTSSAHQS